MPTEITESKARLSQLERVIEAGVEAFISAGRALGEIRDSKLYLEEHKTFALYLDARWGISKSHAYRLIEQAQLHDRMSQIGDAPKTQSHLEALGKVPEDRQSEVWQAVKDAAGEDKDVTAKFIQEIAADIGALPLPEQTPEPVSTVDVSQADGRVMQRTPCPNCGAIAWREDDADWWECSKCFHPYGEPLDGEPTGQPKSKHQDTPRDTPRDIVMDAIEVIDSLADGNPTREVLHRIKLLVKQMRDALREIV